MSYKYLFRLQHQNFPLLRLFLFSLAATIGILLISIILQGYQDLYPILRYQTSVFKKSTIILYKPVSFWSNFNRKQLFFTQEEIEVLSKQPFVHAVTPFLRSAFNVTAFIDHPLLPRFYTALFLESIPKNYLNIASWDWDSTSKVVPLVFPKHFLHLYNVAFAQSQQLPLLSEGMIKRLRFRLHLSYGNRQKVMDAAVVGFTEKFQSVLVPPSFLQWANRYFRGKNPPPTRLLVQLKNPLDSQTALWFKEKGYETLNPWEEVSKVVFILRWIVIAAVGIGGIIFLLSLALIVATLQWVFVQNQVSLRILYYLGYTPKQLAFYYQCLGSLLLILGFVIALFATSWLRNRYLSLLENYFSVVPSEFEVLYAVVIVAVVVLLVYWWWVFHRLSRIVKC